MKSRMKTSGCNGDCIVLHYPTHTVGLLVMICRVAHHGLQVIHTLLQDAAIKSKGHGSMQGFSRYEDVQRIYCLSFYMIRKLQNFMAVQTLLCSTFPKLLRRGSMRLELWEGEATPSVWRENISHSRDLW